MPELIRLYIEAMDDELEKLKAELIEMQKKEQRKCILNFLSIFL